MKPLSIYTLFETHKELSLSHRYITNTHIKPLLNTLGPDFTVETIGASVMGDSIYAVKIGNGKKRILMWSQMHGNESTTTKAIFDIFNTLAFGGADVRQIIEDCTLYIIPILNPDGAKAYTRINANAIDLNRDAQLRTQPESQVLRAVFESFKPHFCYNLHGQRTIFSVGRTNKPATVSFLSPAQDSACTVTPNRKIAMEVIGVMDQTLQELIPNQVGVYDDAFNLNCVGDTFQSENVPTMLFEAGHFPDDYARDKTRGYIYTAMIASLLYIAKNDVLGDHYKAYFNIPENGTCFYDIIIRNAKIENINQDIGILYKEVLVDNKVHFSPVIMKIEDLKGSFGHKEIDAAGREVRTEGLKGLCVDSVCSSVLIENNIVSLELE
ncbi:M14 family zinc carboxypeptidase [Mariniflexile ostreae]|uniref:M14 family zinc carboxypeptidase n=1 Tax=Mariniflexile ostreae TaxID=1520892 RepID=A0ABV5FDQ8_9FLAO